MVGKGERVSWNENRCQEEDDKYDMLVRKDRGRYDMKCEWR